MNQLFNTARERLPNGTFVWPTMQCVMLAYADPSYVFDPTDLTQADIGSPAAVSSLLTGLSVFTGGYCRSNYVVFPTIGVGTSIKFLVLAEQQPTPANRKLIAYINTGVFLPFTPNGGEYVIQPDWLNNQGWFRV